MVSTLCTKSHIVTRKQNKLTPPPQKKKCLNVIHVLLSDFMLTANSIWKSFLKYELCRETTICSHWGGGGGGGGGGTVARQATVPPM